MTAQDDGHHMTKDPTLLDRARSLGRVLFTHDHDFLVEAARRQRQSLLFSGIVYAHPLAVSIGKCIADLELIAKVMEPSDMENRLFYLPL